MKAISDWMNRAVVEATAGETVAEVAARMSRASVGSAVLVEEGALAGVFSERDLLERVVAAGKDPATTEVGSVATREVVTVGPEASLRACADTLKSHDIRHLPVVEGRRVVGVISARDFFQAASRELEQFIERTRYEEQLRENVDPYDHLGGSYGR
jgi:CBS domain-containing protein